MPKYNKRTQVLLSEAQYDRLVQKAREQGSSLGSLVRDAIDQAYPAPDYDRRKKAFERIMAMEEVPVPDWETLEEEIMSRYEECPPFPEEYEK